MATSDTTSKPKYQRTMVVQKRHSTLLSKAIYWLENKFSVKPSLFCCVVLLNLQRLYKKA